MLGSLVIVYPTAHQGGELVLRHKGGEWKFDANALTSLQSPPSLAYVAFYSDIEHEVLKVTAPESPSLTTCTWFLTTQSRVGSQDHPNHPRSRQRGPLGISRRGYISCLKVPSSCQREVL